MDGMGETEPELFGMLWYKCLRTLDVFIRRTPHPVIVV